LPTRDRGSGVCWPAVAPLGGRRGGSSGEVSASPRVQKKNEPCLGSLALSCLCRNIFVPLLWTGVDCTFPLPVPYGPLPLGPQGLLISCPNLREKTATLMVEQQGRDILYSRIGTPLLFLWPSPSFLLSVWVLYPLVPFGDQSSAVGPSCRTLPLVDGVGVRPQTCLLLLLPAEGEGQVSDGLLPTEVRPGFPLVCRPRPLLLVLTTRLAVVDRTSCRLIYGLCWTRSDRTCWPT